MLYSIFIRAIRVDPRPIPLFQSFYLAILMAGSAILMAGIAILMAGIPMPGFLSPR